MKNLSLLYASSLSQWKLLNLWHRMSSSLRLRGVGPGEKADAAIQRALMHQPRFLVQAQALQ